MWPTHFILAAVICAAFAGVTHAAYEDCENPPQVDHASYKIDETDDIYKAIYSCEAGYDLKGAAELVCDLDADVWQGEPPTCVSDAVVTDRKKKLLAIPEEPNVSDAMAEILDMSCIQAKVQAPEIRHGLVTKYERRRKGEKVFLVAYYGCNDNYDFEDEQVNALFCRAKQWVGEVPTCIPQGEYTEEDAGGEEEDEGGEGEEYDEYETVRENDVEEGGEDEAEGGEEEQEPAAPPPPPPPVVEPEVPPASETPPEPESVPQPIEPEIVQPEAEPEVVVPVEVEEPKPQPEPEQEPTAVEETQPITPATATDINIVVEPTQDPYTPRLLDENCGEDRGGCAHKCQRLLFPGENEPRLKCSCYEGYTLDPHDYANCHDIDECQESNGGCSQICNNLPGSFECACEKGYQIDTVTRNTCVDIDECAQPEISEQCAHGCENLPGSYRCMLPLNSKEGAAEEEEGEDESEPEENNEIDVEPHITRVEEHLECSAGYRLSPDGKQCVDIDECAENSHNGCEHCLNIDGGYECVCPTGYDLSTDGKHCQDINECDIVVADDEDDEHVPHRVCQQRCENTLGSYHCGCQPGHHLLEDQRSCAPDNCQDLDNPQLNRTRCAHHCVNLPNGRYECICPKGYKLAADLHNCEVSESACSRENGHERCRPGTCQSSEDNSSFSCLCPPGYTDEVYSCKDIDECTTGTHKCSHNCLNTAGGYQCLCPVGMLLAENEHSCVTQDVCAVNNNGCEQLCLANEGGACACRSGYRLSEEGKSCIDVDECKVENGGCQQLCRNLPGTHACACDAGYELAENGHSCDDIDECADAAAAGCSNDCINKPGSYECTCPLGYILHEDLRSCRPALVGCPPGSRQTAEGCAPMECAAGLLLGADGSCVDIDECQLGNGGCSHQCINRPSGFECGCPAGMNLVDGKQCVEECGAGFRRSMLNDGQCVDVDECALASTCQHKCENTPGSYKCLCPAGYHLASNGRDCVDVDECSAGNGGCLGGSCINQPGSFKCQCAAGQSLSSDGRTCLAVRRVELDVRDTCMPFQAPANGQARCNKYRHKQKRFYNTRCRVWCNKGFQLQGAEIRSCGAAGNWEGQENKCLPITQRRNINPVGAGLIPTRRTATCPALQPPRNGVIFPASCTQGSSNFGAGCHLRCHPGFAPATPILTSCMIPQGWSFGGVLECRPFGPAMFSNQLPGQLQSTWLPGVPAINSNFRQPIAAQTLRPAPFIKCPQNAVILLNPGQSKAHVVLQRPLTNLDYRHVIAHPAWASQLQAHLHAGIHEISYQGRDPANGQNVGCKTVITIKHATASNNLPEFSNNAKLIDASSATAAVGSFCTPSFEVRLKENQNLRSIAWEEPRFEGNLLKIYKTHFPGALFGLGDHTIRYEATTTDGITQRCTFQIHVKAAAPGTQSHGANIGNIFDSDTVSQFPTHWSDFNSHNSAPASLTLAQDQHHNHHHNHHQHHQQQHHEHESYVVCPNQEPVKVTDRQSVNLPVGCTLKNVRKNTRPQAYLKRGLLTSLWRPYGNF